MYNKQSYKNELGHISGIFNSFVKESSIEDFAEEANNSLSDRAHSFLSSSLDLKGDSLQLHHLNTLKNIAINPFRIRSETISLDLIKLFHAGYSTSADLDIQEDFLGKNSAIGYEMQGEIEKPTADRYCIGNLAITYPAISSGELYQLLSPSGLFCPGNITDDEVFRTSKSIADRLAYDIYQKDRSRQFSHVFRGGDHNKQSGITGLANLISGIFSNNLIGKKTTVGLYMTAEPDFLIRKNHERLSELLDGFITTKIVRKSSIEYDIEQ